MSLDPRTPVIIGASRVSQWPEEHTDPTEADDAIGLMSRAVSLAAEDSGRPNLIPSIQQIAVVGGLWRHSEPGRLIAERLGSNSARTMLTSFGGQIPVSLTGHLAAEIAAGRLDMAVMVGGEATVTRHRLRKLGLKPVIHDETGGTNTATWGPPLDMGDEIALERGATLPVNSYAIVGSAIRARRGHSIEEAIRRDAEMWERYARVAATNPHASDRSAPDSAAIRNPSPSNRMVSWPYTKAMCANNTVDRAGALILCSTAEADRLGVDTGRRVYPRLSVEASDTANLLTRDRIDSVPGLHSLAEALRVHVGDLGQVSHLDIYACFPSIVDLTFDVLELHPDAVPTVTGGLAFAGAPMNFAAGQSLAAMVQTLRDDRGSLGMVHGNGGHAAKHAVGVFSTEPPPAGYREVDRGTRPAKRTVAPPDAVSDIVIDGYTIEHTRAGRARVVAACRLPDGSRCWGTSAGPDLMSAFAESEGVGSAGLIDRGEIRI